MSQFAKLFDIEGYQVVAYKDFEELADGTTTYRIVVLVGIDGGVQQVGHGYRSEEKRDEKFEALDEEGARLSLYVVLEAFGIPY